MSGAKANRGSFVPGRSGNPGGRPADGEIAAIARRYTPDAIRALVDVCRNAYSQPGARVSAALGLLDRGWGKPKQELELNGAGDALHLHLYAVQRLEAARAVAETLDAPPLEGTPASFAPDLLPAPREDFPHEALPLWDAARERAPDAESRDGDFPASEALPEAEDGRPVSSGGLEPEAAQPQPEATDDPHLPEEAP